MTVVLLFLELQWVGLQCVNVVFSGHTRLLAVSLLICMRFHKHTIIYFLCKKEAKAMWILRICTSSSELR